MEQTENEKRKKITISRDTYTVKSKQETLVTLEGVMLGRKCVVMVDSGATNNFVSTHWIKGKDQIPVQVSDGPSVQLADGTMYKCSQVLPSVELQINHYKCMLSAYVFPLKSFDVILGTPWLKEVNPDIDWRRGIVEIMTRYGPYLLTCPRNRPTIEDVAGSPESCAALHQEKTLLACSPELRAASSKKSTEDARLECAMACAEIPDLLSVAATEKAVMSGEIAYLAVVRVHKDDSETEYASPQPSVELSEQMRIEFEKLTREFKDVFPDELVGLPPQRDIDHTIEVELPPGQSPPSRPYYRMSFVELAELKKQIQELLDKGYIRPSKSPYGAPVLFVKKKGGALRMCIDYRALNKITIKNRAPLPRVDDILDRLQKAKVFTSLDLRSGYYQVRIAEGDIPKTAFRTMYGHYEFVVMPFGLTNAPATFQTMMNQILMLTGLLGKSVEAYLDDVLIYTETVEEHIKVLRMILELFRKHKLFVNLEKCEFFKRIIDFLGHTLTADGIMMDAKKVKAIVEWPAPTKVAELQSFLGLTSYYRRFVDSYALRTDPLTRLLKKDVPFVWGPEQEASFVDLKRTITTAPVLVAPDPEKPFVVVTDASGMALGAVLMQDQGKGLQPLCFASRKLCDAETRYPTHERELLGIVYALKQWRHYLLNAVRSVVYTDHHPLKYLENQPKLSLRQARWMELLQEYNIYVDYLPGKANVVADALSRRPDYLNMLIAEQVPDNQVEAVALNEELIKKIKDAYGLTEESKRIMDAVAHSTTSPYREENGLYYKNDRVYIPEDEALRQLIISEHHDSMLSGHLGQDKTLELVQRSFFWPLLELYVRSYVETCPVCALSKNENKKPAGLHQPFKIPKRNWQVVSLDYVTGLPKTDRGNDCMLVLVDKLSKFLVIVPTTTKATAKETARLYFDHILCEHGLQEVLISDRDPRFTSEFWTELHKLLGTKLNISTAYRPQTDGQTERANRTLEEMLRSYCMDNQNDWDLYVKPVAFAYNNSKNSSTNETPFYMNYGFHPTLPQTLQLQSSRNQGATDMATRMQDTMKKASEALTKAIASQTQYVNAHRRDIVLTVGDLVYLKTKNLAVADDEKVKLRGRFAGPFKITKKISDVAYQLQLPSNWKIHPVFHVDKLKKAPDGLRLEDHNIPEEYSAPSPAPLPGTTDIFEIEGLLKREWRKLKPTSRKEVLCYLVKWRGFDESENSWEPHYNIDISPQMIELRKQFDAAEDAKAANGMHTIFSSAES